jgi:L-histidine Nalpha-methyltransferase
MRSVFPTTDASVAQFAADVQYYLIQEPRQLPSHYLYDTLGSALFEAICRLPWYRITRAEERLLERFGAEIFGQIAPVPTIVELGSGSGEKLRALIEAGDLESDTLDVHLVDVSPSALDLSVRTLSALERVHISTHEAPYEVGLSAVTGTIAATDRALVLFLGSNIGNFDPPGANALLCGIRGALREGDALLLGADLVKPEHELLLAYDDPLGVSAAFNRNLLVRINRELGGNFDLDRFVYQAAWNKSESRVEMHLVARRAQHVVISGAQLEFAMGEGERIWTESSYKYRPDEVVQLLNDARFRLVSQWLDHTDQFALTLVEAVA